MESKRKILDKRFAILVGLQILICVLIGGLFFLNNPPMQNSSVEIYRDIASRLASNGLMGEAGLLYEKAYHASDRDHKTKSRIAYSLGELYEAEAQLAKALSWYYQSEKLDPHSPNQKEIARKIVSLLERLGKSTAAKRALKEAVKLDQPSESIQGSVVVAKIGDRSLFLHEVEEAIDLLPKELQRQFQKKEEKIKLLQNLVAEEVLTQKAIRLGLDKKPSFQKKLGRFQKQILVEALLKEEMGDTLEIDEADLKNYFEAHKERYQKDKKKKISFEKAKPLVEQDYRSEKRGRQYQQIIDEAIKGESVQIFSERIQ